MDHKETNEKIYSQIFPDATHDATDSNQKKKRRRKSKPWYNYLVISRENRVCGIYRIVVSIMCVIGAILYAFFSAFGYNFETDIVYEDTYVGLDEKSWS